DWIELYNFGQEPVNLMGFGLSDDYDRPFRWVLPDIILSPGEFLLVWASGKNRRNPEYELHTNFSISSAGEEILLTSYSGERLDELEPVELPTDISIGRLPDGTGEWVFFSDPTPNATNAGSSDTGGDILDPPLFSHIGGFYQEPFELDLSHPDPNVSIYYTMDGSTPTTESKKWTQTVILSDRSGEPNSISEIQTTYALDQSGSWRGPKGPVPKATVIRAIAVKDGYLPSQIETHTYFLPSENHDLHKLPVFSLATDPENLFDHDYGIYIPGADGDPDHPGAGNFINRGIEWERVGSLEFFETSGERVLSTDAGVRIHGNWTRRFAQKSLRLYARNAYGDNRFYHPFFEELPYDQYNRLILRNSGNDWGYALFRDALAQQLVSHLNFDTQAYRPSVLYINGEYWGIHNIRERYDRHYLNRVYGLEEGEIDLLTGRYFASEGDSIHWIETLDYAAAHDLSIEEHYDYMQTRIDIDNYLNYFITNIFFANNDWPHNNYDYFRKRVPYDPDAPPGHDGRWRWLLVDVDRSFNLSTRDSFDMIEWVTSELSGRNQAEWPNLLFRNLLENEHFKHQFINKVAGHLNTTFHPDRLKKGIQEMTDRIEPEIENHIYRWQWPASYDDWFNHYAGILAMNRFADNRA
ncbi:CotH kinase family protein, partial [Balneolaceae bacterium ANBcel3]|nr:CotH kinase family protein [Balneolaceae bacterium ANBcel3]